MHAVVMDTGERDITFVREVLRGVEYAPRVTAVGSGRELLTVVRKGGVDLVLSPCSLPDMMLRRLRYGLNAIPWDGTMGVFTDDDRTARKALEAGAQFALRRPLDKKTLLRALQHFRLLKTGDMPQLEDVEDTWSVALRRPFELNFTDEPININQPGALWMAEYGEKGGDVSAITLFDESLGFGLGAAVSLLPPTVAREALRRRAASERICHNLTMICEMLTDLYGGRTVELRGLRRTAHIPKAIRRRARSEIRLDLDVNLKDYGRGRAAFMPLGREDASRSSRSAR